MLKSLYEMLDDRIAATDGEAGTVQDFLFDDKSWIIHYMVAEIASPRGKRKVLILPFALGRPDREARRIPVYLTFNQIRTGPALESDMLIGSPYETGLKRPGPRLRSAREFLGYRVRTTDGELGTIDDLIVEDTLWGVHRAVVGLKQRTFRSVLLSPETIRSISSPEKTAWVNLSLQELERNPACGPPAPANCCTGTECDETET